MDLLAGGMHPNKALFMEGVGIVMRRWTALRMAVEMGWAGCDGEQRAQDLADALITYFEENGNRVEEFDVEDLLVETMSAEFCTQLEDDSEVLVAKSLCLLFRQSVQGQTDFLDSLRRLEASSPVPKIEAFSSDEESEASSDAE